MSETKKLHVNMFDVPNILYFREKKKIFLTLQMQITANFEDILRNATFLVPFRLSRLSRPIILISPDD